MNRHPQSTCPSDPAGSGLNATADGRMWFDRHFGADLDAAGLTGFDRVMTSSAGHCLRVLKDRENWYLELKADDRPICRAYLKRHHIRTLGSRLRALFGGRPGESAGRVEARNIDLLAEAGIDSMRLITYGEALHGDGRLESFILTEALTGHMPLDDFLRSHADDCRLDQLIHQVARVASRFHAAGYNHRDLYCCHFFIRQLESGEFGIRLIDLQRVQHRTRFRRRWLVKDLAQLAYSAPQSLIDRKHRMAFIKHYLGVRKLRAADKRLVRAVLAKQRRLERKCGTIE